MDIERICDQIKSNLKTRNVTQNEFATMLNTSTPTIKRWLKGEGLLFKDLTRMLGCLELKLSEVSLMAEGELKNKFTYSTVQEEALATTEGLLAFFDLLLKGKTPSQIAKSNQLTEKSLSFYLSRLDKIKLIEWLPKNKAKLLVSGEPTWIKGGPLSQKFRKQIVEGHLINHLNDREQLKVAIYSLSKDSLYKVNGLMTDAVEKIRLLEIKDSQSADSKKLTTIILGYGQNDVPILTKIPNK